MSQTRIVPERMAATRRVPAAANASPTANLPASTAGPEPVVLLVTIRPHPDVEPGGYRGRVVVDQPNGAVVADSLYILVATTPTLPW